MVSGRCRAQKLPGYSLDFGEPWTRSGRAPRPVQRQRNTQAAKRLLRKLLKKRMRPPRVMITKKLTSYGAGKRETSPVLSIASTRDLITKRRIRTSRRRVGAIPVG
jgi:hypothetical protein